MTLSPELKARLAKGDGDSGQRRRNFNAPLSVAAGGIVSSANDMLKFISGNLGLTNSSLAASMRKTHEVQYEGSGRWPPALLNHSREDSHHDVNETTQNHEQFRVGMAWIYRTKAGYEVLSHGGFTRGYRSLVVLDQKKQRGLVLLSNSTSPVADIAWRVFGLKREPDNRPTWRQVCPTARCRRKYVS